MNIITRYLTKRLLRKNREKQLDRYFSQLRLQAIRDKLDDPKYLEKALEKTAEKLALHNKIMKKYFKKN
jgi:hypothetical protein